MTLGFVLTSRGYSVVGGGLREMTQSGSVDIEIGAHSNGSHKVGWAYKSTRAPSIARPLIQADADLAGPGYCANKP